MRWVCGECGERFERGGYCPRDGKPIAATEDALVGAELGRYRIVRMLAEGGMGRVYLGVQPAIGSRVAIKVLGDTASSELLERFFAEARAVNLIRHENIVSVIDMAKLDDGRPYIMMEYIDGHTLAALVRNQLAPLGGIVQVMIEVLSALAAAHAIGIVHRDLKPDNVLVTGEGHAKVLDFGIAKLLPGISQQLSPRTRTGALLGTPAYMAPEQISGSGQIDVRTDIYAAGIVLYEAVTGRVPFAGETLFDLMRMHLEATPQPPRALRPDLPPSLEDVILQALAKDPEGRFQTAAAMAQALQHASAELPPDAWRSLSRRGAIMTGPPSGQRTPQHPTTRAAPTPHHDVTRAEPRQRPRWPWIVAIAGTAAVAVVATWIAVGRSSSSAVAPAADAAGGVASTAADAASATVDGTAPKHDAAAAIAAGSATPAAPPPRAPRAAPPPAPAAPAATAATPKQIIVKADYDPKNFDPVRYLPRALALARHMYPDAKLTRFDFEPVFSDGRVDLTMPGDDRSFWYRSEAASKRPAGVPPNVPVERPCMIYVELHARHVVVRIVDNDECDDKLVRDPKCSLASVWKQALAMGVPPQHVAKIGWLFDEKWFFDSDLDNSGRGETTSLPDKCR